MFTTKILGGIVNRVIDAASTAAQVVGRIIHTKEKIDDTFTDTIQKGVALVTPKTAEQRVQQELVEGFKKAATTKLNTMPRIVPTNTMFYKRMAEHYLVDYLANPTAATAKAAIDKIGAKFEGPASPGNYWEEVSLKQWNDQPIPEALRKLRPKLPATIAAATNVLGAASVEQLPFIDAPQLIGGDNTGTGADADVSGGGRNISQLMHWATGVKYCDVLDQKTARDLFFAYEMWHLEGWDVFGEDAINDMIAEEGGRLLGEKLLKLEVNNNNLASVLGECFMEARAWTGSIIALRQKELDAFASAPVQPQAKIWWKDKQDLWPNPTLLAQAMKGTPVDKLIASPLGQRIASIYTLIEDAKAWEKKNGTIEHSLLVDNLVSGKLDKVLAAAAQGTNVTPQMAASAFVNAGGIG